MKCLGTEKYQHDNSKFSVHVVDALNSTFTVVAKKGFLNGTDSYKKRVYTNGNLVKIFVEKNDTYCKTEFKVVDGDWLIILDEDDNVSLYINEQYCGRVQVKNKKVQTVIDGHYARLRQRIDSKREFAKSMGAISRKLNLPFQIVLAFKGNENLLNQMVQNIDVAINSKLYEDQRFMANLSSSSAEERVKAIEMFGIMQIPNFQSEKIASYLYSCLENQKVVRRCE